MTIEFINAISQLDDLLGYLPKEEVEKIPINLRDFFKKIKNNNYDLRINPYKELEKQELLPKTKILLTIIYRNYWCTEEEKVELDKILFENDIKYEKELLEKYDPNNMFKKVDNIKTIPKEKDLEEKNITVYSRELWYEKIVKFIKRIFNK